MTGRQSAEGTEAAEAAAEVEVLASLGRPLKARRVLGDGGAWEGQP